jgi:cell division protein FtsL
VTPRRAQSGPRRGRSLIAVLFLGFVVVATGVIWRRGYGLSKAVELQGLTRRRDQLRAERASLQRRIGELTGRNQLGTLAERQLNMHIPADSQVIVLPAPGVAPVGTAPRHAAP